MTKQKLILLIITLCTLCALTSSCATSPAPETELSAETSAFSETSISSSETPATTSVITEEITSTEPVSLPENTADYATTDEEELILYDYESIPLLGFKTRDDIINDFLSNDDLINFSQEDKTEEEILQNLIDKNVITIYTFCYTGMGASMWVHYLSLEERDKLDSFQVAHKKFGDNFDDFYNFELSIYTQDCLEEDLFADFWDENGQIYAYYYVFERICWGYDFVDGYSFDITDVSDSEIIFDFYIYRPYHLDSHSVYLNCTKRSAVKENGEWKLTELIW